MRYFAGALGLRILVAVLSCWFFVFAGFPVQAQSLPPAPVRSALDENGVDLTTGALWTWTPGITIGHPGAGGLSYARFYDSGAQGWRDNLTGTINSSGSAFTVSLFGASQVFTASGASLRRWSQMGRR
jgi:hypothetical protein